MFVNNLEEQNVNVLEGVVDIALMATDILVNTNASDDLLSKPNTVEKLNEFNSNVEEIIVHSLRTKLGI